MRKEPKICGYCQKSMPEGAKKVYDPFDLIVYGEKNLVYLHDNCYENLKDEV